MLIQLCQLLISTNIKSANQMAQYIYAFRHGQEVKAQTGQCAKQTGLVF